MSKTVIELAALKAPARIRVDRWGIPHIAAGGLEDLFFMQGLNVARDRLWQLDLWRKRGLGLLAADFGPGYLMQDRASRLLLYRGDMEREWAAYGEDARLICTAFAGGINAWIDRVVAGQEVLPPEFERLGTRPAHWLPEDVVRIRSHSFFRSAVSKMRRGKIIVDADLAVDRLRINTQGLALEPADEAAIGQINADKAAVIVRALEIYQLATGSVTFTQERLSASLHEAGRWTSAGQSTVGAELEGSNQWALDGSITASGRPIMASDPHRMLALPSLRYLVHLSAPGLDLIGAGEPATPGIMMGHNGTAAFSLTIFCADQDDIHLYDLAADGTAYRYKGRDEPIEIVEERIAVKDEEDQLVRLAFTRHGPILDLDADSKSAVALRSVIFEPGAAPYMASLRSMRARDYDSFERAMAHWAVPATNQVYADAGGKVSRLVAGLVPRRDGWSGVTPVPGSGDYEWNGFFRMADVYRTEPSRLGFVHSANENNLPASWTDNYPPIGFEWFADNRAHRVAEVLKNSRGHGIEDSCALQSDTYSQLAARLVACLPAKLNEPHSASARDLLAAWDKRLDADSPGALLFEFWFRRFLAPQVLLAAADGEAACAMLLAPGDIASIVELFEGAAPAPQPLADPAHRVALLAGSLATAYAEAIAEFGPRTENWRWGDLHTLRLAHALSAVTGTEDWDIGPIGQPGSDHTVLMSSYDPANWQVQMGASVRLVVDVGDWDRSVCVNAPGQSGLPGSPHYRDLLEPWANGDYVPLLYSDEAIGANTALTMHFVPVAAEHWEPKEGVL